MHKLFYRKFNSPIGKIRVAGTSKGICFVWLSQDANPNFERAVETKFGSLPVKDKQAFKETEQAFQGYFKGRVKKFDLPLDIITGTKFQKRVWMLLREIPFGQIRSYKWVAEQIGMPEASRAVGNANGKNPIPVIIPCHRVVCSNGGLGGYSSGIEIKKKLLSHEGVTDLDLRLTI